MLLCLAAMRASGRQVGQAMRETDFGYQHKPRPERPGSPLGSDEAKSTQPKTIRHQFFQHKSLVCTNPSACEAAVPQIMLFKCGPCAEGGRSDLTSADRDGTEPVRTRSPRRSSVSSRGLEPI